MDPLLKWPGGKRSELGLILPAVPAHTRVIEPFAGGAAVALALEPADLWLNDAQTDLIAFYRALASGDRRTRQRFTDLAAAWALVGEVAPDLGEALEAGRLDDLGAADAFARAMGKAPAPWGDREALRTAARASAVSKRGRIAKLEQAQPMPREDRVAQRATAFHAAFYTWIRNIVIDDTDADTTLAAWWLLRELCYGSMFRYNRAGRFNIPYGGASYDRRDLVAKVERLFSSEVRAVLGRATLTDLDFRAFFRRYGRGRLRDFMFIDPPYDSAFSSYADRAFGPGDQEALAELIGRSRAQVMLVIKRTDFIERLYRDLAARDPRLTIARYDHRYGYNVRGRNERAADHLLITTFPLPETTP